MPAAAAKPKAFKLTRPDPEGLGEIFNKRFDRFWKLYYPVAKDYAKNGTVEPSDLKRVYADAEAALPAFANTLERSRKHMEKGQIQAFESAIMHFDYLMNAIFPFCDTSRFKPKPARRGDKGSTIKAYQNLLQEWHFYKGKNDGKFGEGMEEAVEKFQKMQKLKVDGKIGKKTAERIVELGLKLGYAQQLHKIC